MSQTSYIFDFDGVIGNTFEPYSEFISHHLHVSIEHAHMLLIQNGLSNKKKNILYTLVQNWYFRSFRLFLKSKGNLLFVDRD